MKLKVERIAKKANYTIGKLYINDVFFSNTLEDTDRGLTSNMKEEEIKKLKVYGETAIPIGTYNIDMNTISPKFKDRSWAKPYNGKLPRLQNVKGFSGILIHVGNTQSDTLGCILVGKNNVVGKVTNSTQYFQELMLKLNEAHSRGESITITIN
jgi:hypothetical protein